MRTYSRHSSIILLLRQIVEVAYCLSGVSATALLIVRFQLTSPLLVVRDRPPVRLLLPPPPSLSPPPPPLVPLLAVLTMKSVQAIVTRGCWSERWEENIDVAAVFLVSVIEALRVALRARRAPGVESTRAAAVRRRRDAFRDGAGAAADRGESVGVGTSTLTRVVPVGMKCGGVGVVVVLSVVVISTWRPVE